LAKYFFAAGALGDSIRFGIFVVYQFQINNTTECHQYKPDTDVVKAAKKACTSYLNQCASAK
jgi:hypothetical protein